MNVQCEHCRTHFSTYLDAIDAASSTVPCAKCARQTLPCPLGIVLPLSTRQRASLKLLLDVQNAVLARRALTTAPPPPPVAVADDEADTVVNARLDSIPALLSVQPKPAVEANPGLYRMTLESRGSRVTIPPPPDSEPKIEVEPPTRKTRIAQVMRAKKESKSPRPSASDFSAFWTAHRFSVDEILGSNDADDSNLPLPLTRERERPSTSPSRRVITIPAPLSFEALRATMLDPRKVLAMLALVASVALMYHATTLESAALVPPPRSAVATTSIGSAPNQAQLIELDEDPVNGR